jgi:hypothetical protein
MLIPTMLNFHAFLKPFLPFFVVIFQNVRAFLAFFSPKVRFKVPENLGAKMLNGDA